MPTILRDGPYRVYFFSTEGDEPPHVHVDRDESSAKFWLEPIALARNHGFSAKELGTIVSLLTQSSEECLRQWDEHFSGR